MVDLVLAGVLVLSAASLGVPFLQLAGLARRVQPAHVMVAAIAAALACIVANTVAPQDHLFPAILASDGLGNLFAIVTLSVSLFVAVASTSLVPSGGEGGNGGSASRNSPFYYSLLGFAALGMLLVSYAVDLLMLFVAWELMSLPTYALAGFRKSRSESNEAAVKYAVLGALSSAIILYAISLTYGVAGTTQIAGAVKALASQPFSPIASLAILLFVVGFGFKISMVPFHMWAPDAYEGAPVPVAALLAAGTKKVGFVAAIRVVLGLSTVYALAPQSTFLSIPTVFAVLALLTMTVGNLAALTQKSITRLLAYSSIAQAGYMLIGFVAYSYGQENAAYAVAGTLGMTGTLFHVINHAVMKGAAFLAAGAIIMRLGRGDVGALNGLSRRMPVTAASFSIALLALAGVPPLSGFWSKLLLFTSVLNGPYAWLAVAGVLNSALSMGYYGWMIKRMYMDEPDAEGAVQEPRSLMLVLGVLVALIIAFGLFPGLPISFSENAVPAIAVP